MKKIAGLLILGFLSGCAGGQVKRLKQQVARDLNEIASYDDCPTVCESLKTYIRTKLNQ